LWRTGLYRRYRALLAFLLYSLIYEGLVPAFWSESASTGYRWFWLISQPITWLLSVWVVLELYSLILERHKGLATLGRWLQYAGFTVSTVLSLLVMIPRGTIHGSPADVVLPIYYATERGVDCGMLLFLVCMLFWLSYYPVPLSRNVILHSAIYAALFLSNSVGMFAQLFFGSQLSPSLTTALMGVFTACVFTWLIFLTPKGEEVRVTVSHLAPHQEERILSHLESLNRTLLKISRN
jgi:hypothetical protein